MRQMFDRQKSVSQGVAAFTDRDPDQKTAWASEDWQDPDVLGEPTPSGATMQAAQGHMNIHAQSYLCRLYDVLGRARGRGRGEHAPQG